MSNIEFNCPHCQARVTALPEMSGRTATCPKCGKDIVISNTKRAIVKNPPPVPQQPNRTSKAPTNKVVRAGWICFGLGVFLALVLFVIPIWGFLFIVSLILGIIATSQKEKGGLILLICSILMPPAIALLMILVIFIGGCGLIATGISQEFAKSTSITSQLKVRKSNSIASHPKPHNIYATTSQPKAPKSAAENSAPKSVSLRKTDIGTLLRQLDAYAKEVNKATTTILEKDAMSLFNKKGTALFAGTEINIILKVKDVNMSGSNKAVITFDDLNYGTYTMQAKKAMIVKYANNRVTLPLSIDQAREIRPGQQLTLRVAPIFIPHMGIFPTNRDGTSNLLRIFVKGRVTAVIYGGDIRVRPIAYSIR